MAVARRLPSPLPGRRVVLLVGGGNNGGDALFAGANLARRGVRVTAVLADPDRAHRRGLAALRRAGGRSVDAVGAGIELGPLLGGADVIVDGLVGIGARPPLREPAARLVQLANAAPGLRVAVDLPSGLDPDTGKWTGVPPFDADLTVTFGGLKTGLLLSAAAGEVHVEPLDFPLAGGPFDAVALDDVDVAAMLPVGAAGDDKYRNGVLGIAAGSAAYPGAAVLCAGAAVRTRPGMVRFAGSARQAVVSRWPEVVGADSVADTGRVQAWVVGPGLGTDDGAASTLRSVLAFVTPVLVDADGLTLLGRHPDLLARRAGMPTVLSPHAGEFGRLFPDLDPADRLASARAAAAKAQVTVLLKGDRTVVAAPDGRTAINLSGTPWLATAGSGDVLSGTIGSLLAAGLDPFDAAAAGAFRHGRAGERAQQLGQAGAQALWDHLRPSADADVR